MANDGQSASAEAAANGTPAGASGAAAGAAPDTADGSAPDRGVGLLALDKVLESAQMDTIKNKKDKAGM